MVWRVLGVALVLLVVGVAGGYAVADRTAERPVSSGVASPLPAVSPAVPTPPAVDVLADPSDPPLATDVPLAETTLRTGRKNGYAIRVDVPTGWLRNTLQGGSTWNFAPSDTLNLYVLRIAIIAGLHQSVAVAKASRIAALEDAERKDELSNLEIQGQTEDTIQVSYVDGGHLRVSTERWVSFADDTAFAVVAVTGRTVDQGGIPDLLDRVAGSVEEAD